MIPDPHRWAVTHVVAAAVVSWIGAAGAQELSADELAVFAAEVHAEHCATIHSSDTQAAEEAYAVVHDAWGELDENLRASEVPHPYLLYWRGLLAACLDEDEQAASDLEGFVRAAEFLAAAAPEREGQLQSMVGDSRRRLRRLSRGAQGADERTNAGAALLIAGGLAAGGGFALNAGLYDQYYQPSTADQATYDWARGGATVGLVVGIAGAAIGVTGLVVLIATGSRDRGVAFVVGPVTTLRVRF
jgi:hypothetical protein